MIPHHLKHLLLASADAVVAQVCNHRLGAMTHSPRIEIDFVASLIKTGTWMLQRSWSGVLGAGFEVAVGGVFVHKSPLVVVQGTSPRRMKTNRCELADLLIVHSHRTAGGKLFRRGALMQTKADTGATFTPEDPQFWLYDQWPTFRMASPGLDRRIRDFGGDRRSGVYGLVSTKGWFVTPTVSPMSAAMSGTIGFGCFLVDMLYDMDPAQPGRISQAGRQIYQNSGRDWSGTILDIVRVVGKRNFSHMGPKHGLFPKPLGRRGGSLLYMMQGDPFPSGGDADTVDEGGIEEGGGFGVLEIATAAGSDEIKD